jgi:hypothetical protein
MKSALTGPWREEAEACGQKGKAVTIEEFAEKGHLDFEPIGVRDFVYSMNQPLRYHRFLKVILERYKDASKAYIGATLALTGLNAGKPLVNSQIEREKIIQDLGKSGVSLHLEIESFFLFSKIYLDHLSMAFERYFGQARDISLNSHGKFVKYIDKYAAQMSINLSPEFVNMALLLKNHICEYRDKQIAHMQNPRRVYATSFTSDEVVSLVGLHYSPKPSDVQVNSKEVKALWKDVQKYTDEWVANTTSNRIRSKYKHAVRNS